MITFFFFKCSPGDVSGISSREQTQLMLLTTHKAEMVCHVAQQERCLLPATESDRGFQIAYLILSLPLQHWKRVNFQSWREREKHCPGENAKQMSIQKIYKQIQRLISLVVSIQTNLAIRAVTNCSKVLKRCLQFFTQWNNYWSSILGIVIKNEHMLNMTLLTAYVSFYTLGIASACFN